MGGRRKAARARLVRLAWIPAALALFVCAASLPLLASSCSSGLPEYALSDGGPASTTTSGSGEPSCVGAGCDTDPCANPGPGCPCSIEGQYLACGKVEATYPTVGGVPGSTVCGTGFAVCHNKTWGDCEISGTTTIPDAPSGYYAQGLAADAGPCVANPCDPQCQTFTDTPTGVDAGAGLQATDAGIILQGNPTVCVPKTCAQLGYNCGPQTDGCGNGINCGTCTFPATCGGAGQASVCGVNPNCTNFCPFQVACPSNGTTSISGTVYMPNGATPLPNVLVYVPNASPPGTPLNSLGLSQFTNSVACVTASNCTANASGQPLVATTSNLNGTFKLTNVPAGVPFPVVIQSGRFRRVFMMSAVTACTNAVVPPASSTFPARQQQYTVWDNIPKMAFGTGSVDALECVWLKVGIASTGGPGLGGTSWNTGEFTPGNTNGRINMYYGGGGRGSYIGNYGTTPEFESTLLNNPALMNEYDLILAPCQGNEFYWTGSQSAFETNVANYVNAGGRFFAEHYSYIWLISNPGFGYGAYVSPLSVAINWNINQGDPNNQNGWLNLTVPNDQQIATWLLDIGQSTTLGLMALDTLRNDFNSVNPTYAKLDLSLGQNGSGTPMQASYATPLTASAANQCGKVIYSDFHVEAVGSSENVPFPQECAGGFSPQEYLLAEDLFNLLGCVSTLTVPSCTPLTCAQLGVNCGSPGDGCGGTLSCGTCTAPQTCGGGGVTNQCGTPVVLAPATFTRDYDAATACPVGQAPVWRLFSWGAVTPSNSYITFNVATATSEAGLATASLVNLTWSTPVPGLPPGANTTQQASAGAAGVPTASITVGTQTNGASPDATFLANNLPRTNNFVRVTATLYPDSTKTLSPTLSTWNMELDCVDNQ